MFSDEYYVASPKSAPNSSTDVKVNEITPYPGVNGTGPVQVIPGVMVSRQGLLSKVDHSHVDLQCIVRLTPSRV